MEKNIAIEKVQIILNKSYGNWLYLLHRLSVGKNYYYQEGNTYRNYKIPKKVYKEIEKMCNERLDEINNFRNAIKKDNKSLYY